MSNPTIESVRAEFPPFVEFPSIPRLFREVVITEKVDGTNASIHITEEGQVWAASRTRYIVPLADNFGFATWVKSHEEELREGLGAGQHFGEWYGSGIQRGYGLTNGEKRFALFNVGRWWSPRNDALMPLTEKMRAAPKCCDVVPILAIHSDYDSAMIRGTATLLQATGSKVVEGFTKPEGVVIYHTKSRQLYKYTFDKNDGHKGAP